MSIQLKINSKLCERCGLCLEECSFPSEKYHADINGSFCVECLHCYAVCPNNAIEIDSNDHGQLKDLKETFSIIPEQLESFLTHRRSYRKFLTKSIRPRVVQEILDLASYAPSGGNAHQYQFTVITDPKTIQDLREGLRDYYNKLLKIIGNRFLRRIVSLFTTRQKREFLTNPEYYQRFKFYIQEFNKGKDPVFFRAPTIILIHTAENIPTPFEDCVLAGYQIQLVAQARNIGTCFVSLAQNAMNMSTKLKNVINLSSNQKVYAVVIMGYPITKYKRVIPRPRPKIIWLNDSQRNRPSFPS
jgi:nitroreductase/NAD-dependent dihydropyrimidine dehydrogenase PreA subunit